MTRKLPDRTLRWTVDLGSGPQTALALKPGIRSLRSDSFGVVFQPIVSLADGTMKAQEALARCAVEAYRDPEVLFAAAVEQGAVGHLGRVIREVTFDRCAGGNVFVNIHPEELRSRWLVRPDDPMCLHDGDVYLEITESAALDYFDLCSGVLRELCNRIGAHLVVDDFGAGYSNLKRVVDLEPDVVKLDRALISGVDRSRRQRVLVEHLVKTCRALDAEVVAEGIETIDELKAVRDVGVTLGQGYLLARPAYPPRPVSWPL